MIAISKLAKTIDIKKPLLVFDLETTGPAISTDRIIEIAYIKVLPNGRKMRDDIFLDPEADISAESTEVHGIRQEDIANKPTFKQKAQEIWDVFNDCYYAGYNIINFDLPILRREFIRVGMDFDYSYDHIIDAKKIMQYMEPRSLPYAYKLYYRSEIPRKIKDAGALAEVEAAMRILDKQAKKYEKILDIRFINEIHKNKDADKVYLTSTRKFYWKNGKTYFAFSRYKDKELSKIAESDREFMEWMLTADFPDDLKHIVAKALAASGQKKTVKN